MLTESLGYPCHFQHTMSTMLESYHNWKANKLYFSYLFFQYFNYR